VAGAPLTQADDINASGQIAGAYVDVNGVVHAFSMAGTNFTSFDFPGATSTLAWGINSNGQIVGIYRPARFPDSVFPFVTCEPPINDCTIPETGRFYE
jgi:hypothetical protein